MNLEALVTGNEKWFDEMLTKNLDEIATATYTQVMNYKELLAYYGEGSYEAERVEHFATLATLCYFVAEAHDAVTHYVETSKKYHRRNQVL